MHETERPLCLWCEEPIAVEDGEGFYYEPEPESLSEAEEGFYCSTSCWLAAG